MIRIFFFCCCFLQFSGGLVLVGVFLLLWVYDMVDMVGGDIYLVLCLLQFYKIKLVINKSVVCFVLVVVVEQQKIFSKYNFDVEFVNFGNFIDVLLEVIVIGKVDVGVGMVLCWLKVLEQGFDVKFIVGIYGGCLNLLMVKDLLFGGFESLKG